MACCLCSGDARASQCARANAVHALVAKQIAHVYNQIATDGEDSLGSYVAKASVQQGTFAVSVQTHFSQYDSQHSGSDTMTVVHTISGPTLAVPWFVATDRTSEAHVTACTGVLRVYAGAGYVQTTSSYGYPYGYGPLRGLGAGLERFADVQRRFDVFGSLFYYPTAAGAYGNGSVSYAILSFDGGFRWRLGASRAGFIVGLYEEMRTLRPGERAGFMIRDGPYVGIDF
jgi:hypothetical protein